MRAHGILTVEMDAQILLEVHCLLLREIIYFGCSLDSQRVPDFH